MSRIAIYWSVCCAAQTSSFSPRPDVDRSINIDGRRNGRSSGASSGERDRRVEWFIEQEVNEKRKKKKKEKEWRVRRDKRSTHTEAIRLNRGSLNWTEERRRRKKKVDGGDWVASAIGRPHPFVGWVALWIDTQKHHVKAPTSLFVWPWFSPLTLSLR